MVDPRPMVNPRPIVDPLTFSWRTPHLDCAMICYIICLCRSLRRRSITEPFPLLEPCFRLHADPFLKATPIATTGIKSADGLSGYPWCCCFRCRHLQSRLFYDVEATSLAPPLLIVPRRRRLRFLAPYFRVHYRNTRSSDLSFGSIRSLRSRDESGEIATYPTNQIG